MNSRKLCAYGAACLFLLGGYFIGRGSPWGALVFLAGYIPFNYSLGNEP